MVEVGAAPSRKSTVPILVVWAVSASCIAVASTIVAIVLFVQTRKPPISQSTSSSSSPFLELQESSIPGRYKLVEKGQVSFITLNADHTFNAKDGRTYPSYRWEILHDGLLIVWQKSTSRFDSIESPGVYTGVKPNGTVFRLEKVE